MESTFLEAMEQTEDTSDPMEVVQSALGVTDKDVVNFPKEPAVVNAMSAKAALATTAMQGKKLTLDQTVDKFLEYKESSQNDPGFQSLKQLIVSMRHDQDKTALNNLLKGYIEEMRTEDLKGLMSTMYPLQNEIDKGSIGADAFDRAFVESVSKNPSTDFFMQLEERMIAQQTNAGIVSDMMDKDGWWDKTKNFLGVAFIPDYSKDISDAMKTGILDAPAFLQSFVRHWQTLDAEDQVKLFPQLRDHLMEHMEGNSMKVARVLEELLTPGAGSTIKEKAITEGIFAAIDVAGFTKGLLALVKKSSNTIKTLKELRSVREASEFTAKGIQDTTGKVADNMGMDREAMVSAALPFPAEHLDSTRFVDNISGSVMKTIREQEARVAKLLSDESVLKAEALRPHEIDLIKEKFLSPHRTAEGELLANIHSAKFVDETNRGMKFELTFGQLNDGTPFKTEVAAKANLLRLKNEGIIPEGTIVPVKDGFAITRSENIIFKQSDVGEYLGEPLSGKLAVHLWSPSSWFATLEAPAGEVKRISDAVSAASRADLGKMVFVDAMNKMTAAAVKPLGNITVSSTAKAKLRRVNQVLLQGDTHTATLPDGQITRGKTYTPAELSYGVTLPDGSIVRLAKEEQEAYYGMRKVADWMWSIKNKNTRDILEFQGFKKVDVEGAEAIGSPYESAEAARAGMRGRDITSLYDPTHNKGAGGNRALRDINLDDLYNTGHKVVRLKDPAKIGASHYEFAIVKADNIGDLPNSVLHYKSGYVPKIYKDGNYFVKEDILGNLNGVDGKVIGSKTHRMFGSKKEADLFAETQNKVKTLANELLNTTDDVIAHNLRTRILGMGMDENALRELLEGMAIGEVSMKTSLRVMRDRELSPMQLLNESNGSSGGLFTGPRASHEILYGLDGEVPRRVPAFEALQRYTQHLSNYVPRNEWRVAEQQRWLNKAHTLGIVDRRVNDFQEAMESIKAVHGSPEYETMHAAGRWIQDQARIPTIEEKVMAQTFTQMAEWLEKPAFGGAVSARAPRWARDMFHWAAKKDLTSEARAMAFHSLLGWFNPAQLFVQAQGATVAMSLHPDSWASAMKNGFALIASHASKNPEYIASVGKKMGMNPKEFQAYHRMFKESGLADSIMATSDYAAAAQGYGFGIDAIKKAADSGLIFYRSGELWNRTYSFATATDQWLKRNPGRLLSTVSQKELKEIVNESLHIGLNMTAANRAHWQKGVLGMPTQFMQIQAKWIEAMFPSVLGPGGTTKFDRNQRVKAMLMQMAIYGGAGIPAGGFVLGKTAEMMGYKDSSQIPPEVIKYINGGVWDTAFYSVLGADVEAGGRGAIVSGLVESMISLVYDQHSALAGLGAFGTSASAFARGMSKLAPMISTADEAQFTSKDIAYIADGLADTVATWRNASKAYMMAKMHQTFDKHGNPVFDKTYEGGWNGATLLAQSLGFQLSEMRHLQGVKDMNKLAESYKADVVDQIVDLHINYLRNSDDPAVAHNTKIRTDFLTRLLTPPEREKVFQTAAKRIMENKDQKSKELLRLLNNHSQKVIDEAMFLGGKTGIPYNTNQLMNPDVNEKVKGIKD